MTFTKAVLALTPSTDRVIQLSVLAVGLIGTAAAIYAASQQKTSSETHFHCPPCGSGRYYENEYDQPYWY